LLIPLVVLGHLLGVIAERRFEAAGSGSRRRVSAPTWLGAYYGSPRGRFAIKPSTVAGIYILLPIPGFLGGFIATIWLVGVFLFSSLDSSPFIYFQF
jgi:hypothetical protein